MCLSSSALRICGPSIWGGQGGGDVETVGGGVDSWETRSGPPSLPGGGRAEGGAGPHGETDPVTERRSTA